MQRISEYSPNFVLDKKKTVSVIFDTMNLSKTNPKQL
uniref:Uncharacterized protein n=1 Tax=Myoviridae sp. ctcPl3 TaxID=2826669 RepID=A0A8S5QWW9_9CAUD|nr:MAG TPA: hypothetical protein [Myoviridae sp. ctcPl3]DAL33247.1 MAG TPA_asm: hypothetical protein [Bacteriophage sp.]